MTDTKLDLAEFVGKGYGFLLYDGRPMQVVYQGGTHGSRKFLCVCKGKCAEFAEWIRNGSYHDITRIPQKVRLERWAVVERADDGRWGFVTTFPKQIDAEAFARSDEKLRAAPCPIEFEE